MCDIGNSLPYTMEELTLALDEQLQDYYSTKFTENLPYRPFFILMNGHETRFLARVAPANAEAAIIYRPGCPTPAKPSVLVRNLAKSKKSSKYYVAHICYRQFALNPGPVLQLDADSEDISSPVTDTEEQPNFEMPSPPKTSPNFRFTVPDTLILPDLPNFPLLPGTSEEPKDNTPSEAKGKQRDTSNHPSSPSNPITQPVAKSTTEVEVGGEKAGGSKKVGKSRKRARSDATEKEQEAERASNKTERRSSRILDHSQSVPTRALRSRTAASKKTCRVRFKGEN